MQDLLQGLEWISDLFLSVATAVQLALPDLLELRHAFQDHVNRRIAENRRKSGAEEAAIYGTGTIGGYPIVMCALDFTFFGGSMGSVVGEKVTRAIEHEQRVGPQDRQQDVRGRLAGRERVGVAGEDVADRGRVAEHHDGRRGRDPYRERIAVAGEAAVEELDRFGDEPQTLNDRRQAGTGGQGSHESSST